MNRRPISSDLLRSLQRNVEPGEAATFEFDGCRIEFRPKPPRPRWCFRSGDPRPSTLDPRRS